jgi:hypothetical protein
VRRVSVSTTRSRPPRSAASNRSRAAVAPRSIIDYTLYRRATLAGLRGGSVSSADVCDAHPYLLRAARFHGEPTEDDCPICRRDRLTHVTYTYGDCFRADTNGRVRQSGELPALAAELPEFTVYVVEVCQSCGWNHLAVSFVLGTGQEKRTSAVSARQTCSGSRAAQE